MILSILETIRCQLLEEMWKSMKTQGRDWFCGRNVTIPLICQIKIFGFLGILKLKGKSLTNVFPLSPPGLVVFPLYQLKIPIRYSTLETKPSRWNQTLDNFCWLDQLCCTRSIIRFLHPVGQDSDCFPKTIGQREAKTLVIIRMIMIITITLRQFIVDDLGGLDSVLQLKRTTILAMLLYTLLTDQSLIKPNVTNFSSN